MTPFLALRLAVIYLKKVLTKSTLQSATLLLCFLSVPISAQQVEPAQLDKHELDKQAQNKLNKAYQLALFHYFQGDFFQALSQFELLELEHPEGLKQLPDHLAADKIEPELLIGGISLAYGLEDQAANIFARLLNAHDDPKTKTLAWMLLGKTYYQKRQLTAAAQAFVQISMDDAEEYLGRESTDEWLYMQSQLHGFLPPAKQSIQVLQSDWLNELSDDSIYRDYVQYNQSLALLQQSRPAEAIEMLSDLANNQQSLISNLLSDWLSPLKTSHDSEEFFALKDRANLTLGYTYLQQEQVNKALQAFKNVRLQSVDSQAALLGYGWAAAKDKDYQVALAIWQRLKELSDTSEYVLEAYLASAYAYEQAFAPIQAIEALQQGLQRYQQELVKLDQAKTKVSDEAYIRTFALNKTEGSFESPAEQSEFEYAAEDHYLRNITLSNTFRTKVDALSSSLAMQSQLAEWRQRMQYYYLMLEEREGERLLRAKELLSNRLLEKLPEFVVQREQLAGKIQQSKDEQDSSYLAPPETIAWQHRLERASESKQSIVAAKKELKQKPLKDTYQQRLARLQGILIWQASEEYEKRLRAAEKELNQLDEEIARAQTQQQKLRALLADTPDFTQQNQRIKDIELRIHAQLQDNKVLQVSLVNEIREQFTEMLNAHVDKVKNYILQAQQAVVRLNDQALRKANAGATSTMQQAGVSNDN